MPKCGFCLHDPDSLEAFPIQVGDSCAARKRLRKE